MKVAVLILLCMLIIYAGFAVRMFMLQSQLKKIEAQNSAVTSQIGELQQYKTMYDNLAIAKERIDSIMPKSPSAVKFYSLVRANRPQYVQIKNIALTDWQGSAVCAIEGELPSAQTLRQAIEQAEAYKQDFLSNEAYNGVVKEVKIVNDMPEVESDGEFTTYKFQMFVSLSGTINIDDSGLLVTTETTTQESTSAAKDENSNETSSTTAANSETTAENEKGE